MSVGILEAIKLRMDGYIPENVAAVRDQKAGKITLDEMWRIINRNISVGVSNQFAAALERRKTKPRKGEYVIIGEGLGNDKQGTISRVVWEDGEIDFVVVQLRSGEALLVDGVDFDNYSSFFGQTRWYLEE